MTRIATALPASGSTSWYGHYSDLDALARNARVAGSRFKTVAAADEPAAVRALCDYECDGTADEVQINAALDSVGVSTIGKTTNGGHVLLIGRNFNVAAPVLMQTQTSLSGAYGALGTFITGGAGISGATAGIIQLAENDNQYVHVHDLGLRNGSGCGVYFLQNLKQEWDAFLRLSNLFIEGVAQHGIRWDNTGTGANRGNMTTNVRVLNAGQSGFYVNCPDSFYINCDAGSSGSHGFNIQHSNGRFVSCKSWFSDGSGFYFRVGRDNQLSGCEAQDNLNHGFDIGSPRNSLSSCCADSNGANSTTAGTATTGSGFYVTARGFNIHGTASDKQEGTRNAQQMYGLEVVGSIKGIANVTTANNALGPVSASAAITAGSVINVIDSTL